jgi:hypothetical protein
MDDSTILILCVIGVALLALGSRVRSRSLQRRRRL